MPRHLSIRVPWHDKGWNGTVCKHPEYNQACRVLGKIAEDKPDKLECECAGNYISPCLREGGDYGRHIIYLGEKNEKRA